LHLGGDLFESLGKNISLNLYKKMAIYSVNHTEHIHKICR